MAGAFLCEYQGGGGGGEAVIVVRGGGAGWEEMGYFGNESGWISGGG